MGKPYGFIDPPTCRVDLVKKAAASTCTSDFNWITDDEAFRVASDPRNQGLSARQIRSLAKDWILQGGETKCVPEQREGYKERRHFHYDIIIQDIEDFPRGLYVYMKMFDADENEPGVNLLNAHPP